jgi:hypothetical protein
MTIRNPRIPRVIDAVVSFVKRYTDAITIIEGSGGPVTRLMAKITGTDRIVKHHGIRFEAVEERPVDRYLLPKAQVMREVYIPRTFSDGCQGEALLHIASQDEDQPLYGGDAGLQVTPWGASTRTCATGTTTTT